MPMSAEELARVLDVDLTIIERALDSLISKGLVREKTSR